MTALSDALTGAQRSALAALEKAYVAGALESAAMVAALESVGISDPVDTAFLLAALDVLKEWGVSAPTMTERVARENGEPEKASDKQLRLIVDLCTRKGVPQIELGGLTKPQAYEIIDSLNAGTYDPAKYAGTYDPAKWSVPF